MELFDFSYQTRDENGNWVEVSQEFVDQFSLEDDHGIPAHHGNHTLINNYLMDFWVHILKPITFTIYLQLVKRCYGDKSQTWPSMKLLMEECNITINTLRKSLLELEKYGFIKVFNIVDNGTKAVKKNLYFVRKSIPLIPVEEYEKFPVRLKQLHDKYIENLKRSNYFIADAIPNYGGGSKIDPEESNNDRKGSKVKVSVSSNDPIRSDNDPLGSNIDPTRSDNDPIEEESETYLYLSDPSYRESILKLVYGFNETEETGSDNDPIPDQQMIPPRSINATTGDHELIPNNTNINKTNLRNILQDIDTTLQELLKQQVSPSIFEALMSHVSLKNVDSDTVYFYTEIPLIKQVIENAYRDHYINALKEIGIPFSKVVFESP